MLVTRALLLAFAAVASVSAEDKYDYVIVGGGTAGLALATRLSRGLPKSSILVLEAGPAAPDELRINIPGFRGAGLATVYDWNFTTIPQEHLRGRTVDVNRGKVLGGSSALNYLCWDRASAAEFDAWEELGNDGWDWNTMIDAMVKSENFTGQDGDRHGRKGPIRSVFNRVVPDALKTWKPTVNKLGVPINDGGSMGGNPIGVMFQTTNIDPTRYTRSYSASSYLPLAGSNLKVMTNSRVAKIEFKKDGKSQRATGVVLQDGTKISAREEVILSAGSIGSPGLLELSGIGQSKVVKAAGITPLLDLPGVGENYQDHIRTSNAYRLKPNISSFDPMIYDAGGPIATEALQQWLDGKVSWYDYTSSAFSFLNWGQITGKNTEADIVRAAKDGASKSSVVDQKKLDFLKNRSVPQLELIMDLNYVGIKGYPGGNFITIFSSVMHPMSRGYVHINPKDPLGKPIIDPKFLSSEYDVLSAIEGAKFVRKVAQTQPMASLWEAEYEPGPEVQTQDQWRNFILNATLSFYHPVGTCAMLPKKDGGVVDSSLVVYGTSNLRIVDCSIMPFIISAHIQSAAYGIAEVAADIIISDAKK